MENITSQTYFHKCELIIIDANEKPNKKFLKNYSSRKNIRYFDLKHFGLKKDPGVYGCWNLAIKTCNGKYITNANVDDRRHEQAIEKQYKTLRQKPYIDLVYYRTLETEQPNETMQDNSASHEFPCLNGNHENLIKVNSPHCQPMWRKKIHDTCGLFNETLKYAADYDMWLKASALGFKMQKLNQVLGLYYRNPKGISSKLETLQEAVFEVNQLKLQYQI